MTVDDITPAQWERLTRARVFRLKHPDPELEELLKVGVMTVKIAQRHYMRPTHPYCYRTTERGLELVSAYLAGRAAGPSEK